MKRILLAGAIALALGGCALTGGVHGLRADAERADTDASLAYVGIASTVNAFEASPAATEAQRAAAEGLKRKAWAALVIVHSAYAQGQAVDLKPLQDLAHQVAALGH